MAVSAVALDVVVMMEALRAVPHIAVAFPAAAVAVCCTTLTPLALVSGRQDRYKCSCFAPSNKSCLRGTWSLTCSKGNNHNN